MKRLIFRFLVTAVAVELTTIVIPGIKYNGGWESLALIAVVLAFVNILVKPFLTLLALPVEILTLGLFGIIINAAMLLLVERVVPRFTITGFNFGGLNYSGVAISSFFVPRLVTAVIGSSLISVFANFLMWLSK